MVDIKFLEIKKAVNGLLLKKYPDCKVYGKEIREGYISPCFFTEIIDGGSKAQTKNFIRGSFSVKISYFPARTDEEDQLKKADEIKDLFGLVFSVGKRNLTVGEYSFTFIGEYSDILQITIDIDYMENIHKSDTRPPATDLHFRLAMEKERSIDEST